MNEYREVRNVDMKLSAVDRNDNFLCLPLPLVHGKLKFDKPEIHMIKNELFLQTNK